MNVTDAGLKRHTAALSWEAQIGANTASEVGFQGATPSAQRAHANQAAATAPSRVITLANELRAALFEKRLIRGST